MPNKSLVAKGDECKGIKLSKDRLTIVLACSATGEKLAPMVIGKFKKPQCFQNINIPSLGCMYRNSSKAWMTNWLFNHWLMQLNQHFKWQNRKVLLLVDNAPVHIVNMET